MQAISDLADQVPVRIRAGVALVILELLRRKVHASVVAPIASIEELSWQWVSGESASASLEEIYRHFGRLTEDSLALAGEEAALATVAVYAAYCVMWEAYSSAWNNGEISLDQLPSEVTEGDSALWNEFADAVSATSISNDISDDCLAIVRKTHAGNPNDISCLIGQTELRKLLLVTCPH